GLRKRFLRTWSMGSLLSREASVREATGLLMAFFVLSAMLGSVQQALFNAEFGAGAEASAFYATLRLRDLFFAIIAGRVVSSAVIPVLANAECYEGVAGARRLIDRL